MDPDKKISNFVCICATNSSCSDCSRSSINCVNMKMKRWIGIWYVSTSPSSTLPLDSHSIIRLNSQDFFEMVRNEDEKELARKFQNEHVDTKSATAMFDLLRRKLSHSPAYGHLLSLLQHMLLLPRKCTWLLQSDIEQSPNSFTISLRPLNRHWTKYTTLADIRSCRSANHFAKQRTSDQRYRS